MAPGSPPGFSPGFSTAWPRACALRRFRFWRNASASRCRRLSRRAPFPFAASSPIAAMLSPGGRSCKARRPVIAATSYEVVARQSGLWQERICLPRRRSSSVVERTLGKGEAGSSILPCGTIFISHLVTIGHYRDILRKHIGSTAPRFVGIRCFATENRQCPHR